MNKIAIIGAGASGLMAAYLFAERRIPCDLYEHKEKLGLKLGITGKGRCNFTNNCDPSDFLANVTHNSKFLYSVINGLPPVELISFFENRGLKSHTERGNRVFPLSDKALDVVSFFYKGIVNSTVNIIREKVLGIEFKDCYEIISSISKRTYDYVMVATGGKSYPSTGSTGDGYTFAEHFGHTIVEPKPSLVPYLSSDSFIHSLSGLALKNVSLSVFDKEKEICSEFGELLFTHNGISGPIVLKISSQLSRFNIADYRFSINLKPYYSYDEFTEKLINLFNSKKSVKNVLGKIIPLKLVPIILTRSEVDLYKEADKISKPERISIINNIFAFNINVIDTMGFNYAVITSGGVNVKEINPKTMESKISEGLYFSGEIIDVDAYTGGFNLHIAFSTAYAAVNSIINRLEDNKCQLI